MPIVVTPAEHAEAMKKASSDLLYLFGKEGVPEVTQGMFYHMGITTTAKLASIASSVDDFKLLLKDEFLLDPAASIVQRVRVAEVCCAYNTAVARAAKMAEVDGELEGRHLPKPLAANEYAAMRSAWQNK